MLRSAAAGSLLAFVAYGDCMTLYRDFNEKTGMLRFRVLIGHGHVTAFMSLSTWRARYGLDHGDGSLLELYLKNQPMIDAAVIRKVNAGAPKSVVLMASDL